MKQTLLTAAAAIGLVTALASCSTYADNSVAANERSRLSCFQPSDVATWEQGPRSSFLLKADHNEVYSASIDARCDNVDWSHAMTMIPRTGAIQVCEGDDATVIFHALNETQRCRAFNFHRLTDAEVAALPAKSEVRPHSAGS